MANTAGNLGTTWGWGLGENNWKAAHDKNLRALDALVQCHIIERVLITPPATPADGDCYIPATGATGAWAGHANEIARWNGVSSQWEFWVPRKGWEVFNESDNYAYRWSGTAWAGCNFSFAQLDQNYIKRSGETQQINTTGGYAVSGSEVISAGKVGWFTGLNSSGGGTITGGNFSFAASTATYPSFTVPTGVWPTTPTAGQVWSDGAHTMGVNYWGSNVGFSCWNGANKPRWVMGRSGAETGSNAGSDFALIVYDDAGSLIDTPFKITRAAGGAIIINRQLKVGASSNEATGSSTPALGANCPATTMTAPYKWVKIQTSDGSTCYIPAWK